MKMAVAAAWKGLGQTWTNPRVGAVIVKNDRCLAVGYHHRFGQPHAEIDALSHLNQLEDARGATMYVTMEPCSHYGKTPPCADRLVEVGVKRVVVGQVDPHPIVGGNGIKKLRANGVMVDIMGTTDLLNEAYNFYYAHQRPMVTLKYAMSLDGKINQQGDERTQITNQAAFDDSQKLRLEHQAILVGERTFMIDNPLLTVRNLPASQQPVRIILLRDANLLKRSSRLLTNHGPVWVLTSHKSKEALPAFVTTFCAPTWDPDDIVALLKKHQLQSLLVEGGSHIQAVFTKAGLVDKLVAYVAPMVIGGAGLPAVSGPETHQPIKFDAPKIEKLGNDFRITTRRDA